MSISGGLYSTLRSILTTPLTTSTTAVSHDSYLSTFQHEHLICALAVSFCRYTVPCTKNEPRWCRLLLGAILGCMALSGGCSSYSYSYTTICIVQLWSYLAVVMIEHGLVPCRRRLLGTTRGRSGNSSSSSDKQKVVKFGTKSLDFTDLLLLPPLLLLLAILSHIICTSFADGSAQSILRTLTPQPMLDLFDHLFPISELYRSYDLVAAFVDPAILNARIYYLLFVTFNVQVGMGYLGIGFLREEQMRRNQLVRMEIIERDAEEEDEDRANKKVKVDNDEALMASQEQYSDGVSGRTRSARSRTAATPGRSKSRSRSKSRTSRSKSASAKSSVPLPTTTTSSSATDDIRTKQLKAATTFRRSAAPFIFFAVLPYMFQIIFYGNMNMYVFHCVRDDVHREVRINGVFGHDAHLVAMAENSAMGPGAFAVSMDTVVSTTYDIFNRKLFSLPKLMLLPGVVMRQPMLLVQIFPFVFFTDFIKARLVAFVTTTVENLEKEAKDIKAIRQKVEAFDMKNAELLQRSGFGATEFTMKRWEELTVQHQDKKIASELLKRSRTFFQWLQRNFIFVALIDCALAQLIAVGRIVSAEIFVFSRAIEDTVDLLLMRSRAESELATMMTEIDKLQELADVWENSQERSLLPCVVDEASGASNKGVVLENVMYSRGTALVRVEHMEIPPGIYAVTGANGSGKSTLFRVLMSCQSNDKPIDLPSSIVMETPKADFIDSDLSDDTCTVHDGCDASGEEEVPIMKIAMPSADVAEISQNFYWPLYTKPIDWIYQEHLTDCDKEEREKRLNRVTDELMELAFSQIAEDPNAVAAASTNKTAAALDKAAARAKLFSDLQEEKEDWFGDLSGGQKSKVELVRKVFLHDACPKVLLIDETMAPLDPASKSLVMGKLKSFCRDSVVLVIYHTDVGRSVSGGDGEEQVEIECVPSNNFFHHNLHVENRMLTRRSVC